ncbi:hypothetical protein Q3G72_021953 [Acer saccharum]|nr:hypothetical protein Q3G72_021953 [Acer saccharum]
MEALVAVQKHLAIQCAATIDCQNSPMHNKDEKTKKKKIVIVGSGTQPNGPKHHTDESKVLSSNLPLNQIRISKLGRPLKLRRLFKKIVSFPYPLAPEKGMMSRFHFCSVSRTARIQFNVSSAEIQKRRGSTFTFGGNVGYSSSTMSSTIYRFRQSLNTPP